ncbi:NAD(P)-binding protein [Epibacterium sp. SM1969]|uniref:NAD(P)-binding protein n=1 Tax=Tritonibacter aquimaris TaxID=2663379 RepID=A0A844AVH4_9RHOB|nr:FAD-dependent monooxygenase [Tritonibacter aquimaris]MQY41206.1 NAD(P)-binding protein [Tritonibacter aquimaris]
MTLKDRKIVIIGAGIGGLAAALALRLQGAQVVVLEQAEEISEVGAGLQITPNGVAVLRALGLADDLAWRAPRSHGVVLRKHSDGREVVRLDFEQYAPDQPYYYVHRSDLIDLLANAVRAAGVQIRLLQKVQSVQAGPAPRVELVNGASCQGDLIIGADGLHSKTRIALNGADKPRFTGQTAWRTIVPNTVGLGRETQLFMGPGRHLVAYPLRDESVVNLVAVQEQKSWVDEGWWLEDDPENLRAAFNGFGGMAGELLAQVEKVGYWGLFRHPVAAHWHQENVAILGDAAHPTLPFMAQGANLALEDAWVLSQALASEDKISDACARYQALRQSRAQKVVSAANKNAWKFHLRGPVAQAAHMALKLSGQMAPEKLVRQFDWIYRHDVTAG